MNKQRHEQKGSGLVIAILLTLVVTAIATGLLIISDTNHRIAGNERDAESALFAAKSGLNYGYLLFDQGALIPSAAGMPFNSFAPSVAPTLDGESFSGKIYDISASMAQGQLYKIESTGFYNRARRTTELVFQNVPEASRYGYVGFNEVMLHNHSGLSGPAFRIKSTVFCNGIVGVPQGLTIDGTIVAAGAVTLETGTTLTGSVYANSLDNAGTVKGGVRTITAVIPTAPSATVYDRIDSMGNKYAWYNGKSSPGPITGAGTIIGPTSSYTVSNAEEFRYTIFARDGTLLANPDLNVVRYAAPPLLDYQGMYQEAMKNEPTYFTSTTAAVNYLMSKRVTEVVDGQTVTTIKIGTPSAPEFIYVAAPLPIYLDPNYTDYAPAGVIKAHGMHVEGGIYATYFVFRGPAQSSFAKYPAGYFELSINALPYCYPAIISYAQPAAGSIATWTPADTPSIGPATAGVIALRAPYLETGVIEGLVNLNGLTYSQGESHYHHCGGNQELIRFNGAELGFLLHNCDYFDFTYDPAVICTRFLASGDGTPKIVSYREIR